MKRSECRQFIPPLRERIKEAWRCFNECPLDLFSTLSFTWQYLTWGDANSPHNAVLSEKKRRNERDKAILSRYLTSTSAELKH